MSDRLTREQVEHLVRDGGEDSAELYLQHDAALRKECADDIAGAYKAWAGTAAAPATAGRTRRGGKGLGSESA